MLRHIILYYFIYLACRFLFYYISIFLIFYVYHFCNNYYLFWIQHTVIYIRNCVSKLKSLQVRKSLLCPCEFWFLPSLCRKCINIIHKYIWKNYLPYTKYIIKHSIDCFFFLWHQHHQIESISAHYWIIVSLHLCIVINIYLIIKE
jgi:hypothetical protein